MPDQWSNSGLQQWHDQEKNPAAPAGAQQAAAAGAGATRGGSQWANSQLGQHMVQAGDNPYTQNAASWYTGFNAEGTNNGWNTAFTKAFIDGQNEAAKQGNLSTYFERGGTGVVTWDHKSSDGQQEYKFGDIVEKGRKVGNVYDMYDRGDADLAMSTWLFDGKQQARIFSDNDRMGALRNAVEEKRTDNNVNIPKALQAKEFNSKVSDRAHDIEDGKSGAALVAGGAAAGAVTLGTAGAAVGSVVPVVGTATVGAAGAAAGAVIGGVGAWLNKDELAEQAARAYEITALANEEHGMGGALTTGLQQWSGFSTKLSSPVGNLTHGLADTMNGNKVGDGKAGYYATDAQGRSKTPIWMKAASLGAAVADGVAQFASPVNRAIYTAQMGGTIVGESAQLATTGEMFDPREGGFDNVFKDDNGKFDPVSGAAGIMKIGIDAVQLGGWRGLAGAVGRQSEHQLEGAGYRFLTDESGNIVGKRATMALLAPSEQIAAISASRAARVAAMKEGRAVTADDFYRAATRMATGSNRLKVAMVNGFGEGYEEVAQAILEPMALDGQINFSDIASSFAYGAAGGVGMSLGATLKRPSQDDMLKNQAYVIETIRRGEEPDQAEFDRQWDAMSPAEKRVMTARSKTDAELTRRALDTVARDQAATMVASEVDAAKAIDSRRSIIDKELMRGNEQRPNSFHVMSGQLDAGRVDARGQLLGDTAPAEALRASAPTIHRLLENRVVGLEQQTQFLTRTLSELPADDQRRADIEQMLRTATLASAVGRNLTDDLADGIDAVYSTENNEDAESGVRQLNRLLESFYTGDADVAPIEGVDASAEELRLAGMHFATLLHSREPKLDAGSYLAMMPRIDWELTRDRDHNLVQVNQDVLQAINGDFDGDKLRAENQLVLTNERFVQARAGQWLAESREIDIATRNFDAALVEAVGSGLLQKSGPLRDEAAAVMANIESAIAHRYGEALSPAALSRAMDEFTTAVHAGSEDARVTLLNALAREAGGTITEVGRQSMRNEWLWLSKVVRANFEAYQTTHRTLRNPSPLNVAPNPTADVVDTETPVGTNRRKSAAVNDAQTLAVFANGNTLFRKFQKIHYSLYNSSVLSAEQTEKSDLYEMVKFYEELGRGVTRSELSRVSAVDSVAGRVLVMLERLVEDAMRDPEISGKFSPNTAMSVFANVKVKDVWWQDREAYTDGKDITLVQLLLKRALEQDRAEHSRTFETDEKLQAKHSRLRKLTIPNAEADDVTAEKAFIEVFGATPFLQSLGGVTGALAPHTTPEQWLKNFASLDENGRADMARFYTNVPEYLDRKESSNIPYTLSEAASRSISAYRSMMDSLLAVGRALPRDRAEVSDRAAHDFTEAHGLIRSALADFRKSTNRSRKDRVGNAELVQQMFEANPAFGRAVLATIPDAAANAVFEFRDDQLYVARWVYETFAIEKADEALFYYWKNLTLAQWNSTRMTVREDESDAPGRQYSKLNSRMQRLLYQFAQEPGQPRFEQLLRKMDEAKNLDQFFTWLNRTPGMKGNEATPDYLPFNDDVATFDAEAGSWLNNSASSDLRTALANMRKGAKILRETMKFREATEATDHSLRESILRAKNGDPAATALDRENRRRFLKALQASHELPRGFGPSAMMALTQGAARGFDAQSHDKGRTATSYGPLGEFQALMDAFAFVPGLERVMETLTAHSIGSLRTNVGDLAKYGGEAMDASGRPIAWTQLSEDDALELLSDSRTKPLALALLTPSALELSPNGTLSERLLMQASLKDLLDDSHYKDLFARDDESLSLDRALRYISLVDARARIDGSNFDALRIVNDLVIARTSSLGRVATEDDIDRLKKQAYLEVARVLQTVGQLQSTPETRDAGVLAEVRAWAVREMQARRTARALPAFTDKTTGDVMTDYVETLLTNLRTEQEQINLEITKRYEGDELARRLDTVAAQYDQNEERIRGMLTDDLAGAVVGRFKVTGDAAVDAAARVQLVEYAMSMTSFPARAPEAADIWSKLASQRAGGTPATLSDSEWETLSRSVMGVYLTDQVLRVSQHVSIPAFPKGDPAVSDARFYKFMDPSFAYLATDLLAEDSPLTAAAVWAHQMAEQPREILTLKQVQRTLENSVLSRAQLGTWTPGLMSQTVEAHQRMDSAAAGQAIAAAGNGPKRWAAIGRATKRTAKVPPRELASTVTIPADFLAEGESRWNTLPVQPAGHVEPQAMPLAQLDNRFFTAVRVNGVEVPLDSENLGFSWPGETEETGYRYVSLDRLRQVVARAAKAQGVALKDTVVEADFFHPDSQPAGPDWMNNAYFEGMSHSLLPDGNESLIATLWSDNGGQISADTQRPLDAGKKGKRAIQPFVRPEAETLLSAELLWDGEHDFAGMLRRKTEIAAQYNDGTGEVDASFYNALYKQMKLAHIVVGTREGKPAAMTAEEVIAHQAANGLQAPLPLEDAKLVKLSPDVLRTMLGETGDQGVPRFFEDEYLLNPELISPYVGISQQMLDRFAAGWLAETGKLSDTSLVNVGQQTALQVRTMLTDAERNARQERITFLNNAAADTRAARYSKLKEADARKGYLAVIQLAMGSIQTERSTFDFQQQGIPIAPRNTTESDHSKRLLAELQGIADRNSYERGWRIVDEGGPDYPGGRLTVESLDQDRPLEHRVVKDDIALVELETFQRPERSFDQAEERLEKTLRWLANSGATIVLGPGDGRGDLRFHGATFLRTLGYAPVAGSRHIWAPVEFVSQSQNERAYESTLTETRRIRPARNMVSFMAIDPIGTDENAAVFNPRSVKLRDRKLLNNILPSATYANYNVPLDDNQDNGLYARALTHLRTVLDPSNDEARATLLKMGGKDPAREMTLREALDRFYTKISNRASLQPEVGDEIRRGDIVPFIHPNGKIVLYRHGFTLPKAEDLTDLQREGGFNIAIGRSEVEEAQTSNDGIIQAVEDRAGHGRTLVLESPLQTTGDKLVLEGNGMKYIGVGPTQQLRGITDKPVFRNGTLIDVYSDAASASSKEADQGRVNNLRNALAFFQFDFTEDLVKFFYPNEADRDATATVMTYNLLRRLADQKQYEIPTADAAVLSKANVAVADLLGTFAAGEAQRGVAADWLDRLQNGTDASAQIARAVILYALTPGADIDNVLKSAGFSHSQANTDVVQTRLVPGIFADLLDNGVDSPVHTELIRRFDSQLAEGYRLHSDWVVEIFDDKGHGTRGYLQFGEGHSSGDNPLLDGQAFVGAESDSVSAHNTMAGALSIGSMQAHKLLEKSRAFAKSFSRGQGVSKLASGDSVWQMLTALPDTKEDQFAGWRRETPAESVRRKLARDENVGFFRPLNTDGWTEDQKAEYEDLALKILDRLNLYGSQVAMVDTWVRDHLGRPYALDEQGNERGVIAADDAIETTKEIRNNVVDGLLPSAGANLPLIDVNHLTTLYLANLNRADGSGWAPRTSTEKDSPKASSWDEWVETAFGTAWVVGKDADGKDEVGIGMEPQFDVVYQLAFDGRMHGYQGATNSTRQLPVSSDILRQRQLTDGETNRLLVSTSADENLLATDPTLFHSSQAQLEEIIGGQRIYANGREGVDPASAKARQKQRIERWRKEVDAPRQTTKRMRGVRSAGQTFIGRTTTTNAFWRSLINLRVGKSLFNIPLVVSAPLDAFRMRTVNAFANTLTGESTGAVGQLHSRLTDRFADTKIGAVAEALGLTATRTMEEQKRINDLVDALSTRSEYKSMIYKELMFQYPSMPGIGKVEKWLEKFAKFGGRMQDPAWGMLPKDLARVYVETVQRKMAQDPAGENIYSTDMLITSLSRDPHWVEKNDLEAHNLGIAAIASLRSVKPNVLALATRGVLEPMSENPRFAINSAGNFLKMMTVFQNFWTGFAINIAGLQGAADFAAFMVDGKEKSRLVRRMQAALRGVDFNANDPDYYDMSEVLESLDLSDSFIKGGVTHTGLFALGLLAGGLGLSGDDDEEKWRRRQAELQGAGFVHDPRKLQNDFRNKDSIFLNWLPFGLDSLFRVDPNNPDSQAMAQMNWVTRSLLSPIIGFERFYENGDVTEILHGFSDALGSHPLVNEQLWNAATDTYAELTNAAADEASNGDHVAASHLLITAVGVMESMLLENSMVNMLYVGADRYDRDPYSLQKIDSDGNPQLDVRGNPVGSDALNEYAKDDGTTGNGYYKRDEYGAQIRSMTENRFGLALLGSLFTGFTGGGFLTGSDMFRRNMVPKTREVELLPQDQKVMGADILAAFEGSMRGSGVNVPRMTEAEIGQAIKNGLTKQGVWWNADEVAAQAKVIASHEGLALSEMTADGREHLTDQGRRAVFEGLRSGTLKLGDASMSGVWMSKEQRDKLRDELMSDITQEGVNLGLTQDQAIWRMRRIVQGVGAPAGASKLLDFIYSDQIPWTDTMRYNQLNTTYVLGPSGYPMATGFTRDGLFGALGIKPVNAAWSSKASGMATDGHNNSVDEVAGINTGLRALEPRPDSFVVPTTEEEIQKAADKVVDALKKLNFSPDDNTKTTGGGGGSGWRNFGGGYRRRGGGGGYGGYSSGGGYSQFQRMYSLPHGTTVYGNSIPFINTSNPIIRRADVRRERVWSERGRLKQWQ